MRQQIASLVAVLATTALLVADSAGPQCAEYETFTGTFDFETSCAGGASGDVGLKIELDHYFGDASADSKVDSESATFENLFVDYDLSECSYEDVAGTGRVRTVDFELWVQPADSGALAQGFTCLGLDPHVTTIQLLPCLPLQTDEDKCTVTMNAR